MTPRRWVISRSLSAATRARCGPIAIARSTPHATTRLPATPTAPIHQISGTSPGPPTEALPPAIDLPAHDRDGLLIDLCGVPGFDGGEIGFAGLIARAGAPAVGPQRIRRRI